MQNCSLNFRKPPLAGNHPVGQGGLFLIAGIYLRATLLYVRRGTNKALVQINQRNLHGGFITESSPNKSWKYEKNRSDAFFMHFFGQ